MIEDHYGHITAVKNADRILQGLKGWETLPGAPKAADQATAAGDGAKLRKSPGGKKAEPKKAGTQRQVRRAAA